MYGKYNDQLTSHLTVDFVLVLLFLILLPIIIYCVMLVLTKEGSHAIKTPIILS